MAAFNNKRYPQEGVMEDSLRDHLVYTQRFNAPLYAQQNGIELLTLEAMNNYSKFERRNSPGRIRKMKTKLFNILERPSTRYGILYHTCVFMLVLASLFLSIITTIEEFINDKRFQDASYYLELSLAIVFTFEYFCRLWSCSCHGNYTGFWGRMRFIRKPYMVIDIIVIGATIIIVSTHEGVREFNVAIFRFLRFLQVLRILRLDRQRGAFKIVSTVVYNHRQELLTCWYMSFILLVACAFLVYLAEKSDPGESSSKITNLGEGMYFGLITLLTVGYGDFYPNNWVAKIITAIFAFLGTAFFALPAGILGSGFALQVAQNQKQKHTTRRRISAVVAIQYTWRCFASGPSFPSVYTWSQYKVQREKRFSVWQSPVPTPSAGTRKSMVFLRKKKPSRVDGFAFESRRSSIGATIPSALELRDRCHSEGNLLLMGPQNMEENQATIVSLPPSMLTDHADTLYRDRNFQSTLQQSTQNLNTRPLDEVEKNAARFIRKTKLFIAIRKFKEVRCPYDVKDVIEQYTEGHMEMFSFLKKFQIRVEACLGIKEESSHSLDDRISTVETKIEVVNGKLDTIIQLLNSKRCCNETRLSSQSKSSPDSIYLPQQKRENVIESVAKRLENLHVEDNRWRADSRFTITPTVLLSPHNEESLSVKSQNCDSDENNTHSLTSQKSEIDNPDVTVEASPPQLLNDDANEASVQSVKDSSSLHSVDIDFGEFHSNSSSSNVSSEQNLSTSSIANEKLKLSPKTSAPLQNRKLLDVDELTKRNSNSSIESRSWPLSLNRVFQESSVASKSLEQIPAVEIVSPDV